MRVLLIVLVLALAIACAFALDGAIDVGATPTARPCPEAP